MSLLWIPQPLSSFFSLKRVCQSGVTTVCQQQNDFFTGEKIVGEPAVPPLGVPLASLPVWGGEPAVPPLGYHRHPCRCQERGIHQLLLKDRQHLQRLPMRQDGQPGGAADIHQMKLNSRLPAVFYRPVWLAHPARVLQDKLAERRM